MANDDGIIRIGTRVDVSSLRAGMEEAAEVARASTQSMASAMEAARAASQNLAQAQQEFGAAAAAGSEQAAAVLQMYKTELESARAAVEGLSASETRETAVLRETISSRMAATAELRAMSGSISGADRAAGIFLSTLPGISTAMQYAFPVAGVAALVLVMEQAVEGIEEFITNARVLSDETGADWLDAAIGQVDGLKDAVKQADAEMQNLAVDMDKLLSESQKESISEVTRTMGPAAGMRAEAEALQQQLTANQKLLQIHEIRRDQDERAVAQAKQLAEGYRALNHGLIPSVVSSQQALFAAQDLEVVKGQIRDLDQTDLNLVQRIADLQAEAAEQKDWISPRMREAQEAARKYEEQVRAMSRETTTLIDKETRVEEESWKKLDELVKKATRPLNIQLDEQPERDLDKYVDDYTKLGAAQVEATEIALRTANAQQEASIRARESLHAISPLAAAYDIAKLHAKEYREQLAALNAQLEVQRQVGKDAEAAKTQNQISQLMGNRSVQQIQDQSMIQQQIAKPWLSAFDQINQGWLQVQNRMLFTTRNIGLEFAKMGQNLVIWGMDSAEKWLLGWAEKELLAVVLHHTTNAQKIASDQAASATQLATGVATNVSLAESYAAVAAAAAAASAAAIPITGWAIAPGAAAAIYASTSAYAAMAAFETGTGYVPRDGVAMLHEGEAVIPAPTVDELRGGGGGGNDLSITQNNHFHGFNPDREFRRQLHRNAADVAAALQRHLRQGGKL